MGMGYSETMLELITEHGAAVMVDAGRMEVVQRLSSGFTRIVMKSGWQLTTTSSFDEVKRLRKAVLAQRFDALHHRPDREDE